MFRGVLTSQWLPTMRYFMFPWLNIPKMLARITNLKLKKKAGGKGKDRKMERIKEREKEGKNERERKSKR